MTVTTGMHDIDIVIDIMVLIWQNSVKNIKLIVWKMQFVEEALVENVAKEMALRDIKAEGQCFVVHP